MEDSLVGKQIREYEILSVIGKGGMGAVYRARHIYLDEERAIKVIRPQFSASRDYLDRFIREARILTRMRHPNLVLLYEFGTLDKNIFFMVLELINGESVLARIRRNGRISIDETVRIIRAAALGLHAAHQQGIIHRDISPDNLLIVKQEGSDREITKVIDFGIAKPQMEGAFTRSNLYIGKPEYGSPERIGVEGVPVDHRADVYSLGVTMYFMVTGVLPFQGKTPWEIMSKHLAEMPAPVTSHFEQGEFPEALNRFILKAIAKLPADRHSSMQEFVEELDEIISPEEDRKQDQDTFLEEAGHELRTRLNAIIGYSEILEEDAIDHGHNSYILDLRKIHAAGKHLLWLIGGSDPNEEVKVTSRNAFDKGKEFYDQMKWEEAIHMWKQAMHEKNPDASLDQWITAAETRLNSEKQIREQLIGLFDRCETLLEKKKLLEAKAALEDAERSSSGNYRIADLRKQMDSLRKKLDREIEKVLAESGYKEILSQQLEKTIALMQENLPELKKTLMIFQTDPNAKSGDAQNVVEKTVFLDEPAKENKNTEVENRREQPSKTSRRKTKQT
jgi:tRNA A-37 threonylcarbamoyl transferase component Bud32/tetratricopeptide (TPR) repeat protein